MRKPKKRTAAQVKAEKKRAARKQYQKKTRSIYKDLREKAKQRMERDIQLAIKKMIEEQQKEQESLTGNTKANDTNDKSIR